MPLSRSPELAGAPTLAAGVMVPTLSMSVTGVQAARLLGRELPLAYLPAGLAVLLTGRGFARCLRRSVTPRCLRLHRQGA